jgi:cellulose synthase (UDP-forming)
VAGQPADAPVRAGGAQNARFGLPPYLVFGLNELQLRFDMRPMHRGDCIAVPADVRAGIDPDSTINLSDAYRFTTLPNLAFFANRASPSRGWPISARRRRSCRNARARRS